jgi:hypothetical protein
MRAPSTKFWECSAKTKYRQKTLLSWSAPSTSPPASPLRRPSSARRRQRRPGRLEDRSTSGADVNGLDSLENDVVIVPKLFRRLVDYLRLGDPSLAGFPAFLDQAAKSFFILSTGQSTTGLDAVVGVTGDTVRMTHRIEELVFDEKWLLEG